jgi:hypothetical protein
LEEEGRMEIREMRDVVRVVTKFYEVCVEIVWVTNKRCKYRLV